jgi:hypothetical protein
MKLGKSFSMTLQNLKNQSFSKWTINILERVDNKSLFLSQGAVV